MRGEAWRRHQEGGSGLDQRARGEDPGAVTKLGTHRPTEVGFLLTTDLPKGYPSR
jgi:hypothetical protein